MENGDSPDGTGCHGVYSFSDPDFEHQRWTFPYFSSLMSKKHRIGWWENLQDTPIFDDKNHGFRLRFSRLNQSMEKNRGDATTVRTVHMLVRGWWGSSTGIIRFIPHDGSGWCWCIYIYMLTWLGYLDGIHGAPYIAASWIRHGDYYCLVVTGTMEFNDFPFSWECHNPNWLYHIFQRGGLKPPTRLYGAFP